MNVLIGFFLEHAWMKARPIVMLTQGKQDSIVSQKYIVMAVLCSNILFWCWLKNTEL